MQIKHILLLLCLPFLLLANAPLQEQYKNHFSCTPTPTWVTEVDFSLDPETHPSQVNVQELLIDSQNHLEKKSNFTHGVIKILTPSGVDALSQLRFNFNPSFETLEMHQIRVYRDKEWTDRLNTSTHKIIQRERRLDRKLYSGELCLVYFLDDIRVGDIIEYSCSIIGETPAFSPHFSRVFYLQENASVEKIHRRVVAHPSQDLYIKHFNTDLEPKINILSPDIKEWVWETCSTAPYLEENDEPSWHNPLARMHITQYKNWYEVAHKLTPFYSQSNDLLSSCPPEVISFIENWKETTNDPIEQATLAIRFVQDKIRYQGFEDGIGAYKPTNPWTVFERRFGDCKDKSSLLQALLKLMGIESTPMLVHSKNGKNLPKGLPNPLLFNHVILQISINGETYWVDSTMNLQGGSLIDNHFPAYHWGLCISEETTGLTELPSEDLKKPVEIVTSISAKTPDLIEISTVITRHGSKADGFRRAVGNVGLKKISDNKLQDLKKKYGAVSILAPMTLSDDRKDNVLISMESYTVPTKTRSGKKIFKNRSSVLTDYLDDEITTDRSSPYELDYPTWVKERIVITNPYANWILDSDKFNVEIPAFHYFYTSSFQGEKAEIQHEIKHKEDHIPIELINDYWDAVDEINSRNIDEINIFIPKG